MRKSIVSLIISGIVFGCVKAAPPLKVEQLAAQPPQQGRVTLAGQTGNRVGEILPIGVNLSNGTDKRFHLDPTQVFAVTTDGRRIVPVPLSEAINLSGDATSLSAEIKSALATGLLVAAAGAAAGAGVGAARGDTGTGAIAGGALGGAAGAVGGAIAGGQAAHERAGSQIRAYALQDRYVEAGYSVTGYVFYPPGEYNAVEAMLRDEEGNPETIRGAMTR